MKEAAVLAIQEYIDEYLFEPRINWPKEEFIRRSYSRWAADEILARIENDTEHQNPLDIIEKFMNDMDRYAELSDDRESYPIFVIAREEAEEIAFLFL